MIMDKNPRGQRFVWQPDDLVIGGQSQDARTKMRLAIGAAADAMSDDDIDRVIAAATASAQGA